MVNEIKVGSVVRWKNWQPVSDNTATVVMIEKNFDDSGLDVAQIYFDAYNGHRWTFVSELQLITY